MKKILVNAGMVIILITVGLSGCFGENSLSEEEKKFVGSWVAYNEEAGYGHITFFSNKTCNLVGEINNWKVENQKIIFWEQDSNVQSWYTYSFSYNNTMLTLRDVVNGIISVWLKYTPK